MQGEKGRGGTSSTVPPTASWTVDDKNYKTPNGWLALTIQVGIEPMKYSAFSSQSGQPIPKDSMVDGIKSI